MTSMTKNFTERLPPPGKDGCVSAKTRAEGANDDKEVSYQLEIDVKTQGYGGFHK